MKDPNTNHPPASRGTDHASSSPLNRDDVDRAALTWAPGRKPGPPNSHLPGNESHGRALLSSAGEAQGPSGSRQRRRSGLGIWPEAGEELFGFRLGPELGRGGFARVFLAEQADLAGRSVALKVSDRTGDEPQMLAQLQHTHIVPIYSLHEDRAANLRAVCMPYFGGASLAKAIQAVWAKFGVPTRGEQLCSALRAVSGPTPEGSKDPDGQTKPTPPPEVPWHRLGYAQAVVWIVARLADALAHAHQRGVLHRDVKPSNVLLAADGQPMLLDFNVSLSLPSHEDTARKVMGGTVAYMAPEHLRAISYDDPDLRQRVDQRSDIYSLGMVLYEMLAGCGPFDQTGSYSPVMPQVVMMAMERGRRAPSLRQKRPDVPWGLESIVRKCLAPEPAARYQQADHLAEDCRRFLADLPLRHAPELSLVERVRKWSRRHPRLVSAGLVGAAASLLLVGTGMAIVGVSELLVDTQERLAVAQAQERQKAFRAGTLRALCLVNTVSDLQDHLGPGIKACEEALGLYEVLDRDDWQHAPDWQRLSADDRQSLGEDVRELLLLLAWSRSRAASDPAEGLAGALALLDRAAAIEGLPPSRALWEDRAKYLEQQGDAGGAAAARDRAGQLHPASARDHYLLATACAHAGRYEAAVKELDKSLALNPQHYWSLVQRGICYQELGQGTLATADFGTCVGLWSDFSWGYFNRGCSLDKSGHKEEAIRDYTAAIDRDADFVSAYVNRGLALLELKQYDRALADFDRAAELGRDDAFLHLGRGVALEGLRRFADADQAFAAAFERAGTLSDEVRARLKWVYGFAVSARLPDQAAAAFEDILRAQPNHTQALYGRAMLQAQAGRDDAAVRTFNTLLSHNPEFVEARRFRAVLQARLGAFGAASEDINWCLDKQRRCGATLYAAACVAALAAEQSSDPDLAAQALALLRSAFERGYGLEKADSDPDLRGIRGHPDFKTLRVALAGKMTGE